MDARLGTHLGLYTPARVRQTDPDQLIESHLPLVRKIAWHTHGRVSSAYDVEELIQIGLVALIEAARAFEDRGQAAFSTYATVRIRGAMIDALRKQATMCRSALRRRREMNKTREDLENRLGREATFEEMAAELELDATAYHALVAETQGVRYESMDDIYSDHSIWFAADQPDALDNIARQELHDDLASAIARLPEREATVLQLYFLEELNLEEIGKVLGVGAARICQIKKVALEKVRGLLSQWEGEIEE